MSHIPPQGSYSIFSWDRTFVVFPKNIDACITKFHYWKEIVFWVPWKVEPQILCLQPNIFVEDTHKTINSFDCTRFLLRENDGESATKRVCPLFLHTIFDSSQFYSFCASNAVLCCSFIFIYALSRFPATLTKWKLVCPSTPMSWNRLNFWKSTELISN